MVPVLMLYPPSFLVRLLKTKSKILPATRFHSLPGLHATVRRY